MTLSTIVALLLGGTAAYWLVRRGWIAMQWTRARSRLLKEARAAGLNGAWKRLWSFGEKNIVLEAQRGALTITLTPRSLGWRMEDPPWTWWWISVEPVASGKSFVFSIDKRSEGMYRHPDRRDHPTGDPAFDDALCVYTYQRDPDADQRSLAALTKILERPQARELLRAIVAHDTDNVSLAAGSFRIARRRDGMTLDDVFAQIDIAARLAHEVEQAFVERVYR